MYVCCVHMTGWGPDSVYNAATGSIQWRRSSCESCFY